MLIPHKTNNTKSFENQIKVFELGGINITTNLSEPNPKVKNIQKPKVYTLADFSSDTTLAEITSTKEPTKIFFNRKNVKNYAFFGSFVEAIQLSINNIIINYPATLIIENQRNGLDINPVLLSQFNNIANTTRIVFNTSYISNPLGLNYLNTPIDNSQKNLLTNILNYTLEYNNVFYNIIEFKGSTKFTNSTIEFTVEGELDLSNLVDKIYITPLEEQFDIFNSTLNELGTYLLKNNGALFTSIKLIEASTEIEFDTKFEFPYIDKYNIDISTDIYQTYLSTLLDFANQVDSTTSNLIFNKLTPASVHNISTEDLTSLSEPAFGKFNIILLIYGKSFDDDYQYINNIQNINVVTYEEDSNTPKTLLPLLLSQQGLKVNYDDKDYQMWKEFFVNLPYLYKSKGTRKPIEFITQFLGIPLNILHFNEYIQLSKTAISSTKTKEINSLLFNTNNIENLPLTEDGYPKEILQTDERYFGLESYFDIYKSIFGNILTPEITNTKTVKTLNTLYDYNTSVNSDTTLDVATYSSCSTIEVSTQTGSVISEDLCNCEIILPIKYSEMVVTPIELIEPCNFIVDSTYEENELGNPTWDHQYIGGVAPYSLIGSISSYFNQPYSFSFEDANGCISNVQSGITYSYVDGECADFTISVNTTCIEDIDGYQTGQAILSYTIDGGTPPYIVTGAAYGDIVNDGAIIAMYATDSLDCVSNYVGHQVDCPSTIPPNCLPISYQASLETTGHPKTNIASVNHTYEISGLPFSVYVSEVVITSNIVTSNVYFSDLDCENTTTTDENTFNSFNGASQNYICFNSIHGVVNISYSVTITLSNGCTYIDTYSLEDDTVEINTAVTYNTTLNPE